MSAIDSLPFHAERNSIRSRSLTPGCIEKILDALEAFKVGAVTGFKPGGMRAPWSAKPSPGSPTRALTVRLRNYDMFSLRFPGCSRRPLITFTLLGPGRCILLVRSTSIGLWGLDWVSTRFALGASYSTLSAFPSLPKYL